MSEFVEGIDKTLIESGSFSESQREFLNNRLMHEISWFAKATRRSRNIYFTLSVISIVTTSLTALVTTANALSEYKILEWIGAGLGLSASISIGFFALYQPWENWKRRSLVLENLKDECRRFLVNVEPYKEMSNKDESFEKLFNEVQSIIYGYKTGYFSKAPFKPENPDMETIDENNSKQTV